MIRLFAVGGSSGLRVGGYSGLQVGGVTEWLLPTGYRRPADCSSRLLIPAYMQISGYILKILTNEYKITHQ